MAELTAWAVSPNFRNTKLGNATIEDKIDVFEDQLQGWIFHHVATILGSSEHSGVAALVLVTTYFEAFTSYQRGESSRNHSGEFFGCGFCEVFPEVADGLKNKSPNDWQAVLAELLEELYKELRCGLFHDGMIRGRTLLVRDAASPISFNATGGTVTQVQIDPWRFCERVRQHFQAYVLRLRDSANLDARRNFERQWDARVTTRVPTTLTGVHTSLGTSITQG